MFGTVWDVLVGFLLSFVVSFVQKLLAIPYIAFLDQRPAVGFSEFPSGPVEQVLEVLARSVSLGVVPSICLASVESEAVTAWRAGKVEAYQGAAESHPAVQVGTPLLSQIATVLYARATTRLSSAMGWFGHRLPKKVG